MAEVLKVDASGALLSANLDLKNPHSGDALEHLAPEELVDEVLRKEAQIQELLLEIRAVLGGQP